ncbi:MAG: lysylphosphatidylglycerol synthase transmembrane domain-containing protein [Candidatus Brocadiia bacterium]
MKKGILYSILILIAIGVVVLIFALVGLEKVATNLKLIGIEGFLAYFIAALATLFLTVLGWKIILRSHGINASLAHTSIAQLIGYSISAVTPSMYVGGEPLKAIYIGHLYNTSKTKVFATAVFAKFQELASLIALIYTGTIIMLIEAQQLQLPQGIWTALLVVDIILGLVFFLALRSIIKNSPIFPDLIRWLGRKGIFRRKMEDWAPKMERIELLVHQAFRHDWKAGTRAFIHNFLSIVVACFKPVIFFYFLKGQNAFSLGEIALIFTLTQISLVLPLTPGALGIYEGGQIGIFSLVGILPGDTATFLVIVRFTDLLVVGAGLYMAVHFGLIRITKADVDAVKQEGFSADKESSAG